MAASSRPMQSCHLLSDCWEVAVIMSIHIDFHFRLNCQRLTYTLQHVAHNPSTIQPSHQAELEEKKRQLQAIKERRERRTRDRASKVCVSAHGFIPQGLSNIAEMCVCVCVCGVCVCVCAYIQCDCSVRSHITLTIVVHPPWRLSTVIVIR